MATNPKNRRQQTSGGNIKFVIIIVMLSGFFIAPAAAMLVAVGMIPTMAASLIDPYHMKYRTRCVGGMNFAGITPFLVTLWKGNNSIDEAFAILVDPMSWLVMYGGAGMGWLMYLGLPTLVGGYVMFNAEQRIESLRKRQNELVAEWGEKVKGGDMNL